MRIIKLKIKNGVYIEFQKKNSQEQWDDFSMNCADAPRPELIRALQKLAPFMAELCELPLDFKSKIQVKGISFSYSGSPEVMGAVISGAMKLYNSHGVLNLNTPHKVEEGKDPAQLLPEGCYCILDEVIEEAELYIEGSRAQGKLPLDGGKSEKKKN